MGLPRRAESAGQSQRFRGPARAAGAGGAVARDAREERQNCASSVEPVSATVDAPGVIAVLTRSK
jgi:hypothetical protein